MTTANEIKAPKLVSGSQVQNFNKCETAWKFGHHPAYNLQKASDGSARTRGIAGHEILEKFYTMLKNGMPYDDAVEKCKAVVGSAVFRMMKDGDSEKALMYSDLLELLDLYWKFYFKDVENWEILEVEYKVKDASFHFIGRIDLIIRYKNGPHQNKIVPVDHKFLYNFWQQKAYRTSPQTPNYLRAMKSIYGEQLGNHLLVNAIRFRHDAQETFKRVEIPLVGISQRNMTNNHKKIAEKIQIFQLMTREEVDEAADRSFVKTTCEYCDFEPLCIAQMEEVDTAMMEQANYKPNTYGYEDEA